MSAPITCPRAQREFLLSGRATFTLVSRHSGARFTYRVEAPATESGRVLHEEDVRFVKVLTGTDNENDYRYVGTLRPAGGHWEGLRFLHGGPKARLHEAVPSVVGFGWFIVQLRRESEKLDQVEFWHAGTCGRCGRKLTDPNSIARGLGPECAGRLE